MLSGKRPRIEDRVSRVDGQLSRQVNAQHTAFYKTQGVPKLRGVKWKFKSGGGTCVLTTHYMEEAERLADDLVIVDTGKVIARGSPAEVIASLHAESFVEFLLSAEAQGYFAEETFEYPLAGNVAANPSFTAARRNLYSVQNRLRRPRRVP